MFVYTILGFPGGASGKEPTCQRRRRKRSGCDPRVGKIPWRRLWQPTPVFLPGESHGQRSLVSYSPNGRKEWDTTEATQHTCVYHITGFPGGAVVKSLPASTGGPRDVGSFPGSGRSPGEGNGNLLQHSCQDNPMDRGAWRATVRGVAESRAPLSACTPVILTRTVRTT